MISIMALLFAFGIKAQESSTTEEAFNVNGNGTITLQNGDLRTGYIGYMGQKSKTVTFYGKEKTETFNVNNVEKFNVGDSNFVVVKKFGYESFGLLLNDPKSKIQVIKVTDEEEIVGDPYGRLKRTVEYFGKFVKNDKILSLNDITFTSKNLAKLTANCEELSIKIKKKSKGYKIGLMTLISEKVEILTKIAEEYQNCN